MKTFGFIFGTIGAILLAFGNDWGIIGLIILMITHIKFFHS